MSYTPDYDLIRFGDKDDKLNRKESAILITDYLLSQTDSKVIAINSAWGTGKTWFVHMWKNELKQNPDYQEKVIPIYYNAWENDDYGDAFIPLLAAINEYLPEDGNKKEAYLNAAKELFVSMISGPLKKLTFDIVDVKEIKEIYDKYKENLSSDFELAISDFQKQKELKENFSNALKEFTLVDKEEQDGEEEKIKKIFIFIDELDRCRPTFAIETLERIKHYFGIENVHFILMQDSEQLRHSVKVLYGNDCDTVGYLSRFFDVDCQLVDYDYKKIFKAFYLIQKTDNEFGKIIVDDLAYLSNYFSLSLRDINKVMGILNVFSNDREVELYKRILEKINDSSIKPFVKKIIAYLFLIKFRFPLKYKKIILSLKDYSFENNLLPFYNEINVYIKILETRTVVSIIDETNQYKLREMLFDIDNLISFFNNNKI